MRRYIFVILLLCSTVALMAQHYVTGVLVENGTEEPLVQATVRLLDKKNVVKSGAASDVMGRFRVQIPKTGRYTIQISCVGYKPLSLEVRLGNDKNFDMGTVSMESDAVMLNDAVCREYDV